VATLVASAAGPQAIFQIRMMQTATTSSTSFVNLFFFDGSIYTLFDAFALPIATISAGAEVPPIDKFYRNLDIPAGISIMATTVNVVSVGNLIAFGAN